MFAASLQHNNTLAQSESSPVISSLKKRGSKLLNLNTVDKGLIKSSRLEPSLEELTFSSSLAMEERPRTGNQEQDDKDFFKRINIEAHHRKLKKQEEINNNKRVILRFDNSMIKPLIINYCRRQTLNTDQVKKLTQNFIPDHDKTNNKSNDNKYNTYPSPRRKSFNQESIKSKFFNQDEIKQSNITDERITSSKRNLNSSRIRTDQSNEIDETTN